MKAKNFIRQAARPAIAIWLIFCFSVMENFGGTFVKSFDFGAGGDNPSFRSHARSFLVPGLVAVAVKIDYRTSGDAPASLIVEIEDAAGRNLATREISAEKTSRQLIVNLAANQNTVHGCEKGWHVRIKTKDGEVPKARIFGSITFSFIDPPAAEVTVEGQTFSLKKGGQVTKQIGGAETFRHPGVVNIKSSWTHSPLTQALPLKFELVRPDGSIAKALVGYGTNSSARPKLDFDYRLVASDTRQTGAWRLQITNTNEQEISEINPSANFTRRCFE